MNETPQVRSVLESLEAALRAKDAQAVVDLYSEDVVGFELAPPLVFDGTQMRDVGTINTWFRTWSTAIDSRARNLQIHTSERMAYAHSLQHMTGVKVDGEVIDLWFRATVCLQKEKGKWRITHVHNSVPFAMDGSYRALVDLRPSGPVQE